MGIVLFNIAIGILVFINIAYFVYWMIKIEDYYNLTYFIKNIKVGEIILFTLGIIPTLIIGIILLIKEFFNSSFIKKLVKLLGYKPFAKKGIKK